MRSLDGAGQPPEEALQSDRPARSLRSPQFTRPRSAIPLGLIFCASSSSFGCKGPPPPRIELDEIPNERIEIPSHPPALRLAVSAMTSPAATFHAYVGVKGYLEGALGGPVTLALRRSYREVNDLFMRGEVDVAFVCSGPYTKLASAGVAEILVIPKIGGQTTYQSLVVVRESSRARSFADLVGKSFAFTDPLSNSGHYYPLSRARELGLGPRFFSQAVFTHGHDNSIDALRRGRVDAAAVDSLVYEFFVEREPERVRGLRVLERSPQFGIPPLVSRVGLDPVLKARTKAALIEMPRSKLGQEVLGELRIDAFVEGADREYDGVRRLLGVVGLGGLDR